MRLAYDNLIDAATAPTALTEDLLYPIENVQNQRLSKRWRSTAATSQTVIVDLGSAQAVDTVAILGHSLTTSAVVSIDAHTSDSWGAPAYTTTLTALTGPILKYLASAETYQYWRFNISDASAASTYVEAGRLWLGERLTIDPSSLYNFSVTKTRSDTVTYGRDRQKYATEGVGWRRFSMAFPKTGSSALTNVLTMYDTVGNHESIIFSNFDSSRSYTLVEPVYCSIVGDIAFNHARAQKYTWNLELEEDR